MNNTILEHINDLFNSYDLFSGTGIKKIHDSIKKSFPDLSEEEIKEIMDYLDGFYKYCMSFANMIANKYKTPFLPKGEEAQMEIAQYMCECQNKYPAIDDKHIIDVFSVVCWLTNR
ncbi:MAG: hypothetical protein K2J32_06975 [Ruminococcus sp.]|nr:hypothetical protein [Ruminococcus sp.]